MRVESFVESHMMNYKKQRFITQKPMDMNFFVHNRFSGRIKHTIPVRLSTLTSFLDMSN